MAPLDIRIWRAGFENRLGLQERLPGSSVIRAAKQQAGTTPVTAETEELYYETEAAAAGRYQLEVGAQLLLAKTMQDQATGRKFQVEELHSPADLRFLVNFLRKIYSK